MNPVKFEDYLVYGDLRVEGCADESNVLTMKELYDFAMKYLSEISDFHVDEDKIRKTFVSKLENVKIDCNFD